jgi:hypothetical protein
LNLATEAASGHAGAHRPHRLIKLPMLLLDVPVTSEAELAFLDALAAVAPDALATVPATDQPTLGRICDALHWKFENLDGVPGMEDHAVTEGTLERLQRRLFSDHTTVSQVSPDDEVEVFSAPGESRECVEIARRVLALARDGIPFDRIAVLLRSPEEYRAHLQERSHARVSRLISPAARCGPTRPAEPSIPC